MSEAQQAPVAAPAPDASRRHALPAPATVMAQGRRISLRAGSTPELYRRWSIIAASLCALAALVGSISVNSYTQATRTIQQNTGPVLVTTQTLLASLAEADAAATAAFLSGVDEDPNARRAHLDARARATAQLEDISALIGDDAEAHEALKDVTDTLTSYVGLIEAARATNLAGLEVGEEYLSDAVETLSGDLSEGAARLSSASVRRLEADASVLRSRATLAIVFLWVALIALVWLQTRLASRSRRILNVPLVAAGTIVAVLAMWATVALQSSQTAFDEARSGAFEAITRTAEAQAAAFALNDAETLALITGDAAIRATTDAMADEVRIDDVLAVADTLRESARVVEADTRWLGYLEARDRLHVASSAIEVQAAFGQMTQAFNGFTFTMEAVLADNRDQFFVGLDASNSRTRGLPVAVLVLPLLAGLLALFGFQLRINEYR